MRIQATLTVGEAKWLIALGVSRLPEVRRALATGRILLKGGTTVSAVCEELTGRPLRISGRISPTGTRTAPNSEGGPHCALLDRGRFIGVDERLPEAAAGLKGEDVFIIGANALDADGQAALMYGVALGGPPGAIISGVMAEIKNVIIAVGLEKLIPGSIREVVASAGRKSVDRSMGAAVGLTPLLGRVITETAALESLAGVRCLVIGRGGVFGAEGATTMIVEGGKAEVEEAERIIASVKGRGVSGSPESLVECLPPGEKCRLHRACTYKRQARAGRSTGREVRLVQAVDPGVDGEEG